MTPSELFKKMPQALIAEKAKDVQAIIQIELSGDEGGIWVVNIDDGQCHITTEPVDKPDMAIAMAADDYMAMTRGELNPMNAFMQGKIKVQGDMNLAMKFQGMFRSAG